MKILEHLKLGKKCRDDLQFLLRRLYFHAPGLDRVPPDDLLVDLGLVVRPGWFFAKGDPTDLLQQCIDGVAGPWLPGLSWWLQRHPNPVLESRVACTIWAYIGKYPPFERDASPPATTCLRLSPPKWVKEKFKKSLPDPARVRILNLFAGPRLISKGEVLGGLKDLEKADRAATKWQDEKYSKLNAMAWGISPQVIENLRQQNLAFDYSHIELEITRKLLKHKP